MRLHEAGLRLLDCRCVEGRVMWRLPSGDRCLSEAEWALIAEGARWAYELLKDEIEVGYDPIVTDGVYFERLPKTQQIAVIRDTLNALLDPTGTPPDHTAANEGALAAFTSQLDVALDWEFELAAEVDSPRDAFRVRRLLRAVAIEHSDTFDSPPPETSEDIDLWRHLIEQLDDLLLWDSDFCEEPEDSWDVSERTYFRSDSPVPRGSAVEALYEDLDVLLYPEDECHAEHDRDR